MEAVEVIEQQGTLRLIKSPDRPPESRYAIVEARDGRVYTMHGRDRRSGPDSPTGMADLLGDTDWRSEPEARRAFVHAVQDGNRFSKEIW